GRRRRSRARRCCCRRTARRRRPRAAPPPRWRGGSDGGSWAFPPAVRVRVVAVVADGHQPAALRGRALLLDRAHVDGLRGIAVAVAIGVEEHAQRLALVHQAVAVVVHQVTDLGGERVHVGTGVVAVAALAPLRDQAGGLAPLALTAPGLAGFFALGGGARLGLAQRALAGIDEAAVARFAVHAQRSADRGR